MQKLTLIITLFFISHTHAGLTEWYFQQQDIDCQSSGELLTPGLVGSNQKLISCYGGSSSLLGEFSVLDQDQQKVRQYLETQLYVENAAKKILQQAVTQTEKFKQIKKDLDSKALNLSIQQWRSNTILVKALNTQLKESQDKENTCSKWRFWNVLERQNNKDLCELVESEFFKQEKAATEKAIANFENANPLFSHPLFQDYLKNASTQSFEEVLSQVMNQSIVDLSQKQKKYQSYLSSPQTKNNMDSLLDDAQTISEFIAINYSPADQMVTDEHGNHQVVSLANARCSIQQKHIAQYTDQILTNFAKDAFLVAIPFGIKGKMTVAIKTAKAIQALVQLRRARGILVAAEGLYLGIDAQGLHKAQNRCEELSVTISQQVELPKALNEEALECQELLDSINTSYALAVLGGTAAVKLSKYDIIDIRKSRIITQGKEALLKASSTIKATLIKQADIIKEQLDEFQSTLIPEPAFAMAIPGSQPLRNNVRNPNSENNYFREMTAQEKKSVERHGRKLDRIKERETKLESVVVQPEKSFQEVFAEDMIHINCTGPCKTELIRLRPGLEKLGETPEGRKLYIRYMAILNGDGFEKLSSEGKLLISECLKVVKARFDCNSFQQEATLRLVEHPHSPPLPNSFVRRVLNSLKTSPSQDNLDRSLTLLAELPQPGTGAIKSGRLLDEMRIREMKNSPDPKTSAKGHDLSHEVSAIKLLRRLGYQIDILPEKEEERKISGIQEKFKKLATADTIDLHKNPDLILNDNFIADIYSPRNVSMEDAAKIAEGILWKTESRNFKKTISLENPADLQNFGKRQTNRVVVYVEQTNQDIDKIAQKIKKEMLQRNPQYVQEAFMIVEQNGILRQISLWP